MLQGKCLFHDRWSNEIEFVMIEDSTVDVNAALMCTSFGWRLTAPIFGKCQILRNMNTPIHWHPVHTNTLRSGFVCDCQHTFCRHCRLCGKAYRNMIRVVRVTNWMYRKNQRNISMNILWMYVFTTRYDCGRENERHEKKNSLIHNSNTHTHIERHYSRCMYVKRFIRNLNKFSVSLVCCDFITPTIRIEYKYIIYDTRDVARHIRIREVHFDKSLITLPSPVQCIVSWSCII